MLIPSPVHAQLGGKPYQQWTAKEAEGLLTNSPWAQTRAGLVSVGRLDPPTEIADTAVTISLLSALPVRQAQARLRQLKNRYDKKSDGDKAAIDAKNKSNLECPACADYYVVAMSPGPGSQNGVPEFLKKISLADLKRSVRIKNELGETRELAKFVNPRFSGDDALFFFSRLNSKGEPLIVPANRMLTVVFDANLFLWIPPALTKFEFEIAKMIVNGQVAF